MTGRGEMVRLMVAHFNEEELRGLTFELKVDYEMLIGGNKSGKIRSLIEFMERRNHMADLIGILQRERPEVNWPVI